MSLLSRLFRTTDAHAVDVHEASRRQADGALLVDVRQQAEWREGHAPNAQLVPLGSIGSSLAAIPRDRDVLLICRSGSRSGMAQRQLLRLGYEWAFNVSGGMNAWVRAGLPTSKN